MPALSILTTTWNRASYLDRVWKGLNAQTCRDFEWIVADDGSDDDTASVVQRLAAQGDFPVLYLRAEAHVGKARMDNEAIARARGELLLWCDSDDWLMPEAVEHIVAAWGSVSFAGRAEYAGLTALAATKSGILANPFEAAGNIDVSWNDLAALYCVKGDMVYVARTILLRENPFPEVDLVIPESAIWNQIGHRLTKTIPKPLKMVEYLRGDGISFSNRMSYNRGRAYSSTITRRSLRLYSSTWKNQAWELITFLRYSIHGEINFREARKLWGDNSKTATFWASVPFASLLAARDMWRGKVVKSHHEFDANRGQSVSAIWLKSNI